MVIVNSKKKWVKLQKVMKTTHFVYLQILSDANKHPKQNRVSCFLIVTPYEKYIVPVNHNEKFGPIKTIDCSESKVCVGDMKSFLLIVQSFFYSPLNKLLFREYHLVI